MKRAATFDVHAVANPMTQRRRSFAMPAGASIDECLLRTVQVTGEPPELLRGCYVAVEGVPVPRDYWRLVHVNAGVNVVIHAVPAGGNILSLVGLAAGFLVPAFGPTIGIGLFGGTGFSLGSLLVKGAISLATSFLSGALASAPEQTLSANASNSAPPAASFSISGVRNSARPYQPIPRVYGQVDRYFPPLGAQSYTEIKSENQFLNMLFALGHGEMDIEDLRIGDTDIGDFTSLGFRLDRGTGPSSVGLFPSQVRESTLNIELKHDVWHIRSTPQNTTKSVVDIGFPAGLFRQSQLTGAKGTVRVQFQAQVRPTSGGSWVNATLFGVSGFRRDGDGKFSTGGHKSRVLRRAIGIRYDSVGEWDVRVRRFSNDDQSASFGEGWPTVERSIWMSIKHFEMEPPVLLDRVALVGMRVKATDQLNGIIDSFNCTVKQHLPVWNGSTWTTEHTRNPAWASVDVLTGPIGARPADVTRLDLDAYLDWATYCEDEGFHFDGVLANRTTVDAFHRQVLQTGRASPEVIDGLYTIVIDRPKTFVVDSISSRNIAGFEAAKQFPDRPHGVKVRYPSRQARHQVVERIVYNDGYSAANATLFESVDLPWTVEDDEAYRFGRYAMAVQQLRPEVYSGIMDAGHIHFTPGDLVHLQHEVILAGLAGAVIRSVTVNGSSEVDTVTLDLPVPMVKGNAYAFRLRKPVGGSTVSVVHRVFGVSVDGYESTLTLQTPVAGTNAPAVGNLILFGIYRSESVPVLVKSVAPRADMTARVTFVDEGADIHTADTRQIPPFDPGVTIPPEVIRQQPTRPVVLGVSSDEAALETDSGGVLVPGILISFMPGPSRPGVVVDTIEIQYQRDGDEEDGEVWIHAGRVGADAGEFTIWPVVEGLTYQIRLRSIAGAFASEWRTLVETVEGFSGLPPNVESVLREGNRLVWPYTPPIDFAGFQLRRIYGESRVWDDGVPVGVGLITTNSFELSTLPDAQILQSILIKAVDTQGNLSAEPAGVTINVGEPLPTNVLLTISEAPAFSGATTNGTVTANVLEADGDGVPTFWPAAGKFWNLDESALFWPALTYATMTYVARYQPSAADVGAFIRLDLEFTGSLSVEYREELWPLFWPDASTSLFWGDDAEQFWADPSYTEWTAWPGVIGPIADTSRPIEIRLTLAGGPVRGTVTKFDLQIDVPDIVETIDDFVVSASGTVRLPIVRTYREIKAVGGLTVQDDGNDGVTVRVVDKDSSGPAVQVLDSSGVRVAGLIDGTIVGY